MSDPVNHENLSAYLDGELGMAEAAELAARLRADPALQAELDALREAIELLRAHGPVRAPAQVHDAILAAVAREPAPGGVIAFLRRPLGLPLQGVAVAAVALVVVAIALSAGSELGLRPAMLGVGPASERPVEPQVAPPEIKAPRADGRGALAQDRGAVPASSKGYGASIPPEPEPAAERSVDGQEAADPRDPPEAQALSGAAGEGDQGTTGQKAAVLDSAPPAADPKSGPELYGGISVHTIALRERDLPVVARLLQKHGALDVQGRDPASRVAALDAGEHDVALRLPDSPSRNAFVADLRRTFGGAHSERVVEDGSLSLAGAQVGLRLVVTPYIPGPAGTSTDP